MQSSNVVKTLKNSFMTFKNFISILYNFRIKVRAHGWTLEFGYGSSQIANKSWDIDYVLPLDVRFNALRYFINRVCLVFVLYQKFK